MLCKRADWTFYAAKTPWAPVIRDVEYTGAVPENPSNPRNDKYGGSTYTVSAYSVASNKWRFDWGVFIPSRLAAAGPPATTKLHIFFIATDAKSAALRHALRYVADYHDSVLLIVPGDDDPREKRANPLCPDDLDKILNALQEIHAPVSRDIEEVRISAHSRGINSLQHSLGTDPSGKSLKADKLTAVTILDASFPHVPDTLQTLLKLSRGRLKELAIAVYDVTQGLSTRPDPFRRYRHADLRSLDDATRGIGQLRGIGYARILSSAEKIWSHSTTPLTLPGTLKDEVDAVLRKVPPLVVFTTIANTYTRSEDPAMPGKKPLDLLDYCRDPLVAPVLNSLALEVFDPSSPAFPSTARAVIENNDLNQLGGGGDFLPYVYAHEYFVAEVWHESLGILA